MLQCMAAAKMGLSPLHRGRLLMNRHAALLFGTMALAWLGLAGPSAATAQQPGRAPKGRTAAAPAAMANPTPYAKSESYSVVQVGDEIRVVRKSELANLKKSVAEDYKRDMKIYQDSKKGKDKAATTKPIKSEVKILKQTCKTEQEANEYRDKLMAEKSGAAEKTEKKAPIAW